MPQIRRRTLAPEEAQLAIAAGGPLADMQVQPEKLREMAICVVEVNEQIEGYTHPVAGWRVVAYWVGWYALHLEPLWIDPEWRKHPGVVGGIVGQMQTMAEATGEPVAYCEIAEENLAIIGDYATRLGFHQAPGTLFYMMLSPAKAPVGV